MSDNTHILTLYWVFVSLCVIILHGYTHNILKVFYCRSSVLSDYLLILTILQMLIIC